MSDILEDASDNEELHRASAIKAVRERKKLAYTGRCLYCNETVLDGVFCNAECREDKELEDKIRHIKGMR